MQVRLGDGMISCMNRAFLGGLPHGLMYGWVEWDGIGIGIM